MRKETLIIPALLWLLTGCTGTMTKLGIENGRFKECPATPNCVNSQANSEKHFIEPIRINVSTEEAKRLILRILTESNQAEVVEVGEEYVRAEYTSKFFQFVDDVEFYLPEGQTNECVIHVRSASRVGYSDLGANRRRIEQIRSKLRDMTRV